MASFRGVAVLALLAAACVDRAPRDVVLTRGRFDRPWEPTPPSLVAPPSLVILAPPPSGAPRLVLEPPLRGEPALRGEVIATGPQTSLVETPEGVFVRDGRGFRGPIPGSRPVPVPKDADPTSPRTMYRLYDAPSPGVVRVDPSGEVWSALSVEGALRGDFALRATIAGTPVAVDANAVHVVVATKRAVHRSLLLRPLDNTRPDVIFREWKAPAKAEIVNALVRGDGTAVIRLADGKALIQAQHDKPLVASRYHPREMERIGEHIVADRWGCPAVLAKDGASWWQPPENAQHLADLERARADHAAREASAVHRGMPVPIDVVDPVPLPTDVIRPATLRLTAYPAVVPPPSWPDAITPPLPEVTPSKSARGTDRCQDSSADLVMGALGLAERDGCSGVGCIVYASYGGMPATNTKITTFGDRECAPADVLPSNADWGPSYICKPGARAIKAPTLAMHRVAPPGLITLAPPRDCEITSVVNARGHAFVVCAMQGKSVRLVHAAPTGVFSEETVLAAPPATAGGVDIADDGTLVLRTEAGFVMRAPVAFGAPRAWMLAPTGTLWARPISGGRLLVVRPAPIDPRCIAVELVAPGRIDALSRGTCFSGNLLDVRATPAGNVEIVTHPTALTLAEADAPHYGAARPKRAAATRALLMTDGSLAPAASPL